METSMGLELELLAELRGALTDHEIGTEVREDVAGPAVATGVPGAKARVFVSFTGPELIQLAHPGAEPNRWGQW